VKITDTKTSGNHSPQIAKFANRVKLFQKVARSPGSGKNSGTAIRVIKPMNMPAWTQLSLSRWRVAQRSIASAGPLRRAAAGPPCSARTGICWRRFWASLMARVPR
jgi:hypothetical protein